MKPFKIYFYLFIYYIEIVKEIRKVLNLKIKKKKNFDVTRYERNSLITIPSC